MSERPSDQDDEILLAASDMQDLVRQHVASQITCQSVDSRVGCIMPMQYADGDNIVVWIELRGDQFHVSDYGESFIAAVAWEPSDLDDLFTEARSLCRPWGIDVISGALSTQAERQTLGDAVWRTATAAAVVGERASHAAPPQVSK